MAAGEHHKCLADRVEDHQAEAQCRQETRYLLQMCQEGLEDQVRKWADQVCQHDQVRAEGHRRCQVGQLDSRLITTIVYFEEGDFFEKGGENYGLK